MSKFRPICDVWIMARPKIKFYGAFPSGFLERARALLGVTIDDAVLHVCSGRVRDYPFWGVGPNDKTVDVNKNLNPDYTNDVTYSLPAYKIGDIGIDGGGWPAILADPPYTPDDAAQYPTMTNFPKPQALLKFCLNVVRPGGRVGMLHYVFPRPPKEAKLVACVGVIDGYNNRMRCYSVFERRD